ncbi:MAG TPA: dTMP kinase, partial [Micromonosporaceae bacterium]
AAVATFIVESLQMVWAPAKESSVPNLLPPNRLEAANQLTLATTYGFAPISAVGVIAFLTWFVRSVSSTTTATSTASPTHLALYFNALTFLASALTVFFGIHEISGRAVERPVKKPPLLREFITGWAYVAKTPLVRGLVLGILGAFAGAGVVVGTAQFYATSLGGGTLSFYILFGSIFVGLSVGIVAGPVLVGALSRRRWFGLSIIFAAISVTILAFAWHLVIGILGALCVGVGAGMAFLSGVTLLGTEVGDDVRGRVFAFIQTGTQVTLLLTISLSSFIVGLGGTRHIFGFTVSTTRPMLLAAGAFGIFAGVAALRQIDDKPGIPIFADLIGSIRGRPLGVEPEPTGPELVDGGHPLPGYGKFIVFEGGEGAGKSTQVRRLVSTLEAYGRSVIDTREPGATPIGRQIRALVLDHADGEPLTPRAEALLYAADRAHHVATVIRPALQRGTIVISDRYVDSSLAYQGAGRTLPPEEVRWLSRWATAGLRPDLVVLLDIDPADGLRRAEERGGKDRLEAESLAFHERVRTAFRDLAAADPERYLVLNASDPIDVIAFAVRERVHALLPPAIDLPATPGVNGSAGTPGPTTTVDGGSPSQGSASEQSRARA